jgi:hypothetical protein
MACNCIEVVDQKLKERNTRLQATIIFSDPMRHTVSLGTEQLEKGRGKAKAVAMLPTFCPFCGVRYVEAEAKTDG